MKRLLTGLAVSAAVLTLTGNAASKKTPRRLIAVATFDHQVTGVSVSKDHRIFVNFPRWSEDIDVSVAEVMPDGTVTPYPDTEWNAWRNARKDQVTPADHFVCVQSVVVDHHHHLWVLDPGAPAQGTLVPGAPKMVRIDLATNKVTQTILFDEAAAPQGSYLNDVRFSLDDGTAYITDSGARGALLVVDVATGKARRVLDGDPSTQPEKDVQVKADGRVLRRTDGRGVDFSADGIALSPDGKYLYWQAIKAKTLYRIATDALANAGASHELATRVERVGENGPADGLWIDGSSTMYITAVEENAIKTRQGQTVRTVLRDKRLRWPDTFSEGPDGMLYVTSSRIMDMPWFKPRNLTPLKTTLFKFDPRTLEAIVPAQPPR